MRKSASRDEKKSYLKKSNDHTKTTQTLSLAQLFFYYPQTKKQQQKSSGIGPPPKPSLFWEMMTPQNSTLTMISMREAIERVVRTSEEIFSSIIRRLELDDDDDDDDDENDDDHV